MILRRSGEILLGLLLLLSLGLKIPGSMTLQVHVASDVGHQLAAFLKQQHFQVTERSTDEDMFLLSAEAGECRLLVAVVSPHGWHRDVIRKLASPGSQLLFVFNGKVYPDQPVLLTSADEYWSRFLRHAGRNEHFRPVLGIVGSSKCALAEMRWSELVFQS